MKLLIVESPGKIKKLRSFLGNGWQVAASIGHICDLPKKELGISRSGGKVQLSFKVYHDKQEVVERLQQLAIKADEIYLATDPDREGEAIAYHVGIALGRPNWNKIRRVSFNEITKEAVEKAVGSPRRIDMDLVHAQQARRVVDRLVGYKVSPLLWKQKNAGNSAGRVQSVAVKLVVEREQEIRNFVSQDYFMIRARLTPDGQVNSEFEASLMRYKDFEIVSRVEDGRHKDQRMLTDEKEVLELLEIFRPGPWNIIQSSSKKQKRRPAAPFITSSLQQAGSTRYKWNATKTMKIAQKLYEKGLITYMRTDSPTVSAEALTAVRSYILQKYGEKYVPSSPHKYQARDSRSQESHECIRPTEVVKAPDACGDIAGPERELYSLIRDQFISSQMAAAELLISTIDIESNGGTFRAKGRIVLFDGWLLLSGPAKKEEATLPKIKKGTPLELIDLDKTIHQTRPPSRYSEASLIKTLEAHSIGRPSTFAAILNNIKQRGYIKEVKRMFHATETGEALVSFLLQSFERNFMDVAFTARMEEQLDGISEGNEDWQSMVQSFDDGLQKVLSGLGLTQNRGTVSTLQEKCPKCEKSLALRRGQYGEFIGCTGYPTCGYCRPATNSAAPGH